MLPFTGFATDLPCKSQLVLEAVFQQADCASGNPRALLDMAIHMRPLLKSTPARLLAIPANALAMATEILSRHGVAAVPEVSGAQYRVPLLTSLYS
jgi:hypothetical protein